MKYILVAFLMFFGLFANESNAQDFEIVEAYSKKIVGGVAGSNSNIDYTIRIKMLKNAEIEFEQMWLKDKCAIDFRKNTNYPTPNVIRKTGTELVFAARETKIGSAVREAMKKANELPEEGIPAPKEFTGQALISYTLNGELFYFEIEKFERKVGVRMP